MKLQEPPDSKETIWPVTLCGVLGLVVATTINAFWSGLLLTIVLVVIYAPITWLVAWVAREIGTLFRWSRRVVTSAVWLLVSLWFLWDGYKESRPEEIFRDHLVRTAPITLKVIAANRAIGIEGFVGIYMEGDSNAFSQVVSAKGLKLETFATRFGVTGSAPSDLDDLVQEQIASAAKVKGLPVHKITSPILYSSEQKAPARDLWISADWSRAYFFLH